MKLMGLLMMACLAGSHGCAGGELGAVGQRCLAGDENLQSSAAMIASPALECPSRTCLHLGDSELGGDDLCTTACASDDDCVAAENSPCVGGFICAIPVAVGPFCCQKQCVCVDYLPEGGLPPLDECRANAPGNTCCNLPGNQELPHCR